MASGSFDGKTGSLNIPDLLLYAGLAVGAYFIYKTVVKPTSDVTGAVGDVTSSIGGATSSVFDGFTKINDAGSNLGAGFLNNLNNAITNQVNSLVGGSSKSSTNSMLAQNSTPIMTSANNYISSVSSGGIVYGTPVVNIKTSTGQTQTIAQTPNTFYPNLGIGFNSKGQGYSSIAPIKK